MNDDLTYFEMAHQIYNTMKVIKNVKKIMRIPTKCPINNIETEYGDIFYFTYFDSFIYAEPNYDKSPKWVKDHKGLIDNKIRVGIDIWVHANTTPSQLEKFRNFCLEFAKRFPNAELTWDGDSSLGSNKISLEEINKGFFNLALFKIKKVN